MLSEKRWRSDLVMHLALWVMVCFFVGNLGGALIEQSRPPGPAKVVSAPSSVWPLVISVVSFQGVILVLTPLFLRRHDTDSNEAFGFRFSWKHAVLLGVVVAYIYLWIGQLLKYLSVMFMNWISLAAQDQISVQVLHNSPLGDRVVLGVIAIAVAPIAEEIFFRGILYPAIKQNGYPRLAIWSTSLAFGAIHCNMATFLPLTCMALVLIWLYERTDNLIAPITAHSVFNALNMAWDSLWVQKTFKWLLPPA